VKTTFWKERTVLDTNANINASSIDFQQIAWVDDFKQLTRPCLQDFFFVTYDPSKDFLAIKKLTIAIPSGFYYFFFASCLSTSPFNGLFTSSSNIFAIIE